MQTSKKVLVSLISFAVALCLVLAVLVVPFFGSKMEFYQDNERRAQMAGTIDTLIVGASQLECGVIPSVMNEELGCTSYNLSFGLLNLYGRRHMIEYEAARNPVRTVVIDLSSETLTRDLETGHALGDLSVLARMDTMGERFGYMAEDLNADNAVSVSARVVNEGMAWWIRLVEGADMNKADATDCGFYIREPADLTQMSQEAALAEVPGSISLPPQQFNVDAFEEIIDFCNANDIQLVVVAAPVPEVTLRYFSADEWNVYQSYAEEFCREQGIPFYNFNLFRERATLYSDTNCFSDGDHLSRIGAEVFTRQICDVVSAARSGQDVSSWFYADYDEALTALG